MDKTIVLIGFMGCGKSTVGRKLSMQARLPLKDTDAEIVRRAGMEITEIFATRGEAAFRAMETETLALLKEGYPCIVSTGGGLPMREENRPGLKALGTVVYLRVTPETVWKRLRGDTTRPLLQKEDPQVEIRRLLDLRGPIYESCADLVIDVDALTPDEIVEKILEAVEK